MVTYNLNRLFKLRGIHNPMQFLTEKGYHKDTDFPHLAKGVPRNKMQELAQKIDELKRGQ